MSSNAAAVKMMFRPVVDWALCNNGPNDHPVWPPVKSSTTKRENLCANPQDLIKGKPVPCDRREFPSQTDQHSNVTATLVDEANERFPLPHGCFEFVVFLSYPAETHSMAQAFTSPYLHPDAETDVDATSRGRSHAHPASPAATKDMQQLFRSMVQAIDRLDRDYHLRRLRVVYPAHDYDAMAQLLDALLTPRLWLALRAETFPFPFSRISTAFRSVSGDAKATYLSSVVDKYHHDLEAALRLHASIAYPDADTCTRRTGLMVSRHFCTHPGWAGVLGMYKYQQSHFTYANMAVYVSESNGLHEVTAFDGGLGSTCTLRNRWHCAFLPSTSCAMPTEITTCRADRCVSSIPETHFFAAMHWHGAFVPPPANYEVITNLSRALSQPLTAQQYLWRRILSNDFRSLEALDTAAAVATAAATATAAGGNELRIAYVDMGDASPLAPRFVTPTDASSEMWRPAAEVADHIAAARVAAAKSPPKKSPSAAAATAAAAAAAGTAKPHLSTVLPGVSAPDNLGRLQYRLPSPQRQFRRWPTPRSEQENPQRRYEPIEIPPQDVVVQAAYLLRHNHRYRAFLAHAQRHFLDLHALQDHLDAAHRSGGDAATAATHGLDFNVDAAATAALLSDAEDDRLAKLFAALATPQSTKPQRRLRSGAATTTATDGDGASSAPTLPRCVAVQLRRGDRVLSSLLPNKGPAAANAAAANATDEEARRAQQKYQEYCAQHPDGDFGCRSVPFAFVSLLNVTEVAHTLVDPDEVSHLVVSTDDEGWLQEQIALLQRHAPQWQVHYLPAPWLSHFNVTDLSSTTAAAPAAHDHLNASELLPHGPDAAHYAHHQHRHKAHVVDKSEAEEQFKKYGRRGLAGGVHFFASMQLLQQCEAFVGHFDSGVAWMMYTAMCHRHRGHVAVCPPVFDLRQLQEFHKVYGHLYRA